MLEAKVTEAQNTPTTNINTYNIITYEVLNSLMKQFKNINISKSHYSGFKKSPASLEGFTEHCNIACITERGTRANGDNPKEALNVMYFDYDGQEEDFKGVINSLFASNQSFLAYPSPSFKNKLKEGYYRYRLVVPTSDGLTVNNYRYNALKFAKVFGLKWDSESWDVSTLKIKQVIYPPVMTNIKEPEEAKPKPRNMTKEDVDNYLSSKIGDVWQVQESFTTREKSELDETLPKQRDPKGNVIPRSEIKEVLIEPKTMLYLNGEELETMEECRGRAILGEEIRCDCPFDDPENSVHSKTPNGYAYFDNKGMLHCRNAHENLRGVIELNESVNDDYFEQFQREVKMVITPQGTQFFNTKDRTFYNKSAMKDAWADRTVLKVVNERTKCWNVVDLQLREGKERYMGITFAPLNSKTDKYNMFQGFAVEPKEGDVQYLIDTYKKQYGEKEAEVVLDFFAHLVQKPFEKIRWCIALKGEKGTMKSLGAYPIEALLKQENKYQTGDASSLLNKFNAPLAENLFLRGDEVVWGGNHEKDSVLKDLLTEPQRNLERKGKDPIRVPNVSRIWLTSNADWIVPASGKGERRYYIIEANVLMSDGEGAKFIKFVDRNREAILHYLLNRKLPEHFENRAPKSKALTSQLVRSLFGIEKMLYDFLEKGYFGNYSHNSDRYLCIRDNGRIRTTELWEIYQKLNPKDKTTQKEFTIKVKETLGIEAIKSGGLMYFKFEDMATMAKNFHAATGIEGTEYAEKPFSELELRSPNEFDDETEDDL